MEVAKLTYEQIGAWADILLRSGKTDEAAQLLRHSIISKLDINLKNASEHIRAKCREEQPVLNLDPLFLFVRICFDMITSA